VKRERRVWRVSIGDMGKGKNELWMWNEAVGLDVFQQVSSELAY